jgi:hypothetical protein
MDADEKGVAGLGLKRLRDNAGADVGVVFRVDKKGDGQKTGGQ